MKLFLFSLLINLTFYVFRQETIKLEGPKVNPLGTAEIDAINNDVKIHYGVRSIPINNGTLIIRK